LLLIIKEKVTKNSVLTCTVVVLKVVNTVVLKLVNPALPKT